MKCRIAGARGAGAGADLGQAGGTPGGELRANSLPCECFLSLISSGAVGILFIWAVSASWLPGVTKSWLLINTEHGDWLQPALDGSFLWEPSAPAAPEFGISEFPGWLRLEGALENPKSKPCFRGGHTNQSRRVGCLREGHSTIWAPVPGLCHPQNNAFFSTCSTGTSHVSGRARCHLCCHWAHWESCPLLLKYWCGDKITSRASLTLGLEFLCPQWFSFSIPTSWLCHSGALWFPPGAGSALPGSGSASPQGGTGRGSRTWECRQTQPSTHLAFLANPRSSWISPMSIPSWEQQLLHCALLPTCKSAATE